MDWIPLASVARTPGPPAFVRFWTARGSRGRRSYQLFVTFSRNVSARTAEERSEGACSLG